MQGPRWTPAQRAARLDKLVERNRSGRTSFLYEDAAWMTDAYVARGLTMRQIADEADCTLRTIARWLAAHGIESRKNWERTSGPARGDAIDYAPLHQRIRRQRGRPSEFSCAHCGEQATEWAYDHRDPNERRNAGQDAGPYSPDINRYIPLCTRCHRKFDLGR